MKLIRTNIYVEKQWLFIIGPVIPSRLHRHYPIEISFSMGRPDRIPDVEELYGRVVNSNIDHEMIDCKDICALILYDPQSLEGIRLNHVFLLNEQIKPLESSIIEKYHHRFMSCWREKQSLKNAYELSTELVNELCGNMEFHRSQDERIRLVLNYLNENLNKSLSVKELVQICGISESRLLHLFKERVGVTIRDYILWLRFLTGLHYLAAGRRISQAASSAGFSDHPHFTRTFRKTFGHPPSVLLKNSRFIQK